MEYSRTCEVCGEIFQKDDARRLVIEDKIFDICPHCESCNEVYGEIDLND